MIFNTKKDYRKYVFLSICFIILFTIFSNPSHIIYQLKTPNHDENGGELFKYPLSVESQSTDNKSPIYLEIQHILKGYETNLYTRIFNLSLFIICTVLLYSITNRYESLLVLTFPFFLDSVYLTDSILELSLILIMFKYDLNKGLMVGLSTITRPYSILFLPLLKKKDILIVLSIGVVFSLFLLWMGVFFPYLTTVTNYAAESVSIPGTWRYILILIMFITLGSKNKELFKWGIMSSTPLLIRTWAHYFMLPYTILLLSYLSVKR